ncbi:uncharacterized protein LOC117104864 [Anneissia japonica]|uniref:uncharacterized protein LOC117104864 n=1 Tax=Anneissia japonica TaxID=1529436 RepID=UPI001425A935|nr:uncharacterized protein LOC117104864 [Anneissia japonica]
MSTRLYIKNMFMLPFGRCIIPVLLILSSIPVNGYDKVYMGHGTKSGYVTCPPEVKINSNGGEISGLVRPYENELNCTVKIEAELGSMIKIKIDKIDFVTAHPSDCYSVKLLIYDGEFFENSNIIPSFPNGLCNQSFPSQTLKTRSNMLSLRFEVTNDISVDVSFQVIYTSYTKVNDGTCFFCGDTKEMCIPDELRCDGLENCANSFDEEDCNSFVNGEPEGGSNATWIAIFATIVVILLVAFIVFLLVYKRHASTQNTNTSRAEVHVYNNDSIYYGPSTSQWTQPPLSVTSSPPSNAQRASCAHGSVAGLPDQPPSYERSLQDAANEDLALKRSLAQD